ncbi:invasion associated locus B family protein [Agrobacterium tumefaciens]|uniref:invasion associated locus B family protein n=1 Tax=Agrobacterium tumefaciens TaxID=358 RepID=UPI00287CF597|nr:invasion associated locus B family protein [Agrobacterium tumefaciens]MDS7594904.1 invasion associated locus B family protein [Agrobacterium tumefaciens]
MTLFAAVSMASPHIAVAQSQGSGPMFSTPAQRSTTGAPILNRPADDASGILNSAGGGAASPRSTNAPHAAPHAAPQEPKAAQATEKPRSFQNWAVECMTVPQAGRQCQITGKTASADQKQTILVFSLAADADKKAMRFQAALPLGIAVQQKVVVAVGDTFTTEFSVTRCTQQGCILEGVAEEAFVNAMKKEASAHFTITAPDGNKIPIQLSLDGFSDAWGVIGAS